MDEALIYVAVISGLFTLAAISLMNMNWFRRERFKTDQQFQKKKYDLEFKKMARDLGLNTKNPPLQAPVSGETPNLLGQLAPLAPLLKNLSGEQLETLIDRFIPDQYEEEGGGGGITDQIADFIASDAGQAIIKGFTQGVKGGAQNQASTSQV